VKRRILCISCHSEDLAEEIFCPLWQGGLGGYLSFRGEAEESSWLYTRHLSIAKDLMCKLCPFIERDSPTCRGGDFYASYRHSEAKPKNPVGFILVILSDSEESRAPIIVPLYLKGTPRLRGGDFFTPHPSF
jgi:hypothetical protein